MTTKHAAAARHATFIRHLTPTALATLSVELEAADRTIAESLLLDLINDTLNANVGEDDAEQLRQWYRDNV